MFDTAALSDGLIIRAMGDTIGFCPPLVIGETEIDEALGKFEDILGFVTSGISRHLPAAARRAAN